MAAKRRGLGSRDLDALLGGSEGDNTDDGNSELCALPLEQIEPGRYQPRTHWDEDALDELADSIRAQGVIQPVVVRKVGRDRYELIAGERRWRASQRAGLAEIPALVKQVSASAAPAMALIENIQREDLSPLEEARAFARLIKDFELTHQQVAEAVGRSRAAVSNLLRLLELPEAVSRLLEDGELQMGHARALLTLEPARARKLAREAAAKGWSVRQLEKAARQSAGSKSKPAKTARKRDADIIALERELSETLATEVNLQHGPGRGGKLVIRYHDSDQLEGVLERLRGQG